MQLVPGAKMLGTTVLEDQVWQKGCRGAGMGVGRPERSLPLRRRLPGGVWGFINPNWRLPRDGSATRKSVCSARDTGDTGSIPESGRYPREGNDNLV